MPTKQELEETIRQLQIELDGVKADCGILLEENGKLMDALAVINPEHPVLKDLYSRQWHQGLPEGEGNVRKSS